MLQGDLQTVPLCGGIFGRTGLGSTAINLDQADPTEVALRGVDRNVGAFTVNLGEPKPSSSRVSAVRSRRSCFRRKRSSASGAR
jgi:hypothetical protein